MGTFIYENQLRMEFEDRALAHLQIVTGNKLRRREPFFFTWKTDLSLGGGRVTVWVHPQSTLVFRFHGSRTPTLNRDWVEALMFTANTPSGLYRVPEPQVPLGDTAA
ncbi:MAG: ATP-dependent DNA ligase [Microbacterium sp. SCN 70-18]|nr:ATP-dependent DNA ligase [Microbacterium chocolatum]ODT12252.1 MAG: ATP-dependent DNA ligase [Microbacterium sp. SCN 70-18]